MNFGTLDPGLIKSLIKAGHAGHVYLRPDTILKRRTPGNPAPVTIPENAFSLKYVDL